MNKPSSTITAAGVAGFLAATTLLVIKITAPEIYTMIPEDYRMHMVVAFTVAIGYFKKENVLSVK